MPAKRGLLSLAATAVVLAFFSAVDARADYKYDVTVSPPNQLIKISDQTTIRITPQSGQNFHIDPGFPNNLPLATISFEKTSLGLENIDVNYAFSINITNPQDGGETKSFLVNGRLFGSANLSSTGSRRLDLNNQYLGIIPASGNQSIGGQDFRFELPLDRSFRFSGPGFGPSLNGTFTAQISVVPEPVSVVLLGIGCVGAFWLQRRRSRSTQTA